MTVEVKKNCKMDIEMELYDAIRLYARYRGLTFDEAVNRLLKYSFSVYELTSKTLEP